MGTDEYENAVEDLRKDEKKLAVSYNFSKFIFLEHHQKAREGSFRRISSFAKLGRGFAN